MTEQRKRKIRRQLQESRMRLYKLDSEFALSLREMNYVATKDVKRISTNGKCIYFNPDWIQKLGNRELDFILSHQLMHIAAGHIERPRYYAGDRFHLACDIVANSTLEQLGWNYDKLPHIGRIYHETFFPAAPGYTMTAQEALKCIPFDPATMKPGVRRNYMIDSEEWWDKKDDCGESGEIVLSPADKDPDDLACDEQTIGGNHIFVRKELFTNVRLMLGDEPPKEGENRIPLDKWQQKMSRTLMAIREATKSDSEVGIEEAFQERIWQWVNTRKVDWKKLLDNFIQEEVCDYSFTPPDRRMQDSEFFLPDYNVQKEKPREVWFMVDTSGSIDEETLSMVYSEINNALAQFNGGLVGVLAFFDVTIHKPTYFSDIKDLEQVRPMGGGGTDYRHIFRYINTRMVDNMPANVVIFTDGDAEFPDEIEANNVPVVWLFSKKGVIPPWGKYAYVE